MLWMYSHAYSKSMDQPGKVRLPILLVVSCTGKMKNSLSVFVPESLVSREGFDSLVPRQPAHLLTQTNMRCGSSSTKIGHYGVLHNLRV